METAITIFTLIIGISLGFYNGWIYKMSNQRDPVINTNLHYLSGFIRFTWMVIIAVIMGIHGSYSGDIGFQELIAAIAFWPGYNFLYNLVHHQKLLYLGSKKSNTKSWIDKYLKKSVILISQSLLLLLTIIYYPLHLDRLFSTAVLFMRQRLIDDWFSFVVAGMLIIFFSVLIWRWSKGKKMLF